jgi:D-glycero-beta-D-manno-heptose-7-phosphate kinase
MNAENILQKLENQRVLIVGDVMLDRYMSGAVTRISPEAPVPVLLHQHSEDRLGGAANVALNIKALGSVPILCSVTGSDEDGAILQHLLHQRSITTEGIVQSTERRTTVKTRVVSNKQQILRIDKEDTHNLSDNESMNLLHRITMLMDSQPIGVVILQDYNKGVLTQEVIAGVIKAAKARNIPTTVDPKKVNFFAYRGVTLFKPNLKEIRDSAPFEVNTQPESLQQAVQFLSEKLHNQLTMITLSEKGLYLASASGGGQLYPTHARNIADVSGAGDTVISIASLALAAGLPVETIAQLSNLAGGQVCEFPGVVPVDVSILLTEMERDVKDETP